ncbi:hypothetical protein RclHR1_07050010 [Rhizophagus clarus]|uniref:Uncharacterized protein n=1 Tax=Rhizophagus clarus TaxID=94130 RepID=A0A2Z6SBW6_9GLOM|nr:hypothetical protein RclHR1_07050010 [Rhizophagus clarus]GES87859.1 hypothetical protein RCL_jg11307.t1 [Rhizophagus clarus]
MFPCICPACLMEKVATPKTTSKNDKQKIQSEQHLLTPSRSYSFLQPWEYDSLFTFNKYTTNISTGISPVSNNSPSLSDNESENRFIGGNKIEQKP